MAKNKCREDHPEWFDEKGRVRPEILRELIDYDPKNGTMVWKKRSPEFFRESHTGNGVVLSRETNCTTWNKRFSDKPAGTKKTKNGNRICVLFDSGYTAVSIAFALNHGRYSENILYLADGNQENISASNIIARDQVELCKDVALTRKMLGRGSSRYFGVSYYKQTKRWVARIKVESATIKLGYYEIEEDAADAYDRAALKYLGPTAYLNIAERPEPTPKKKPKRITAAIARKKSSDDF